MSDFMSGMIKEEYRLKKNSEEFEKMVKKLNKMKIIQKNKDWIKDLSDSIYEKYFRSNFSIIKEGINIEKLFERNMGYETSMGVYEMYGKLLAVRIVTDVFSKKMGIEDCNNVLEFFEVDEVKTVTYKRVI